jgi:hypothetical protein
MVKSKKFQAVEQLLTTMSFTRRKKHKLRKLEAISQHLAISGPRLCSRLAHLEGTESK